MPPANWNLILIACLSSLAPDVLRIIKNRYDSHLPQYLRSGNFWLGIILLVVIGGVVTWLLDAKSVKEAIAYGFGAPDLFSKVFSEPPPGGSAPKTKGAASKFSLRLWWGS